MAVPTPTETYQGHEIYFEHVNTKTWYFYVSDEFAGASFTQDGARRNAHQHIDALIKSAS